jgi:hypothetical protein
MRMHPLILSSAACPAVPRFYTFSKRHYFRGKKKLLKTKCVFLFSLQHLSEKFLIQRVILINVHRSSRYLPVILVGFERNLKFPHRRSKNTQIPNFMKIHQVEAELFNVDRQMDRHNELIVAFRNFANAPLKTVRK